MARKFVSASTQFLNGDNTPTTSFPISWAYWCYPTNSSTDSEVFFIGDKDSTSNFFASGCRLNGGDFQTRYRDRSTVYIWGDIVSVNTWHHCGVTVASNGDTYVYTDGNTPVYGQTVSPSPITSSDRVSIGHLGDSSPTNEMDGYVAEVAFWQAILTASEMSMLAAGYSPLFIRPGSLLMYVPLIRDNDKDIIGGISFTASGSPTVAPHPPVIYPSSSIYRAGAGGPADLSIAITDTSAYQEKLRVR